MLKRLENTTASDIFIAAVGFTIPALDTYIIEVGEFLLWARPEAIAEVTPFLNSGDLVVNDGTQDLTAAEAIRYLEYADRAYIQKDGSDVTRVNTVLNFEGDNVTVTNDGGGKTTVAISDDTSDTLYYTRCHPIPGCTEMYYEDIRMLVDHTLCFIKKVDC